MYCFSFISLFLFVYISTITIFIVKIKGQLVSTKHFIVFYLHIKCRRIINFMWYECWVSLHMSFAKTYTNQRRSKLFSQKKLCLNGMNYDYRKSMCLLLIFLLHSMRSFPVPQKCHLPPATFTFRNHAIMQPVVCLLCIPPCWWCTVLVWSICARSANSLAKYCCHANYAVMGISKVHLNVWKMMMVNPM